MATTIINISHAANDEGKEAMARIQSNEDAPDRAKILAGMIANFNHKLNDGDKTSLAQLFP